MGTDMRSRFSFPVQGEVMKYDQQELLERIGKAIQEMDGDEIADLCNTEFGMDVHPDMGGYLGDGVWEDDSPSETEE